MQRKVYYVMVLRHFFRMCAIFFVASISWFTFGPAPSFPASRGAALVSPPSPMSALDAYRKIVASGGMPLDPHYVVFIIIFVIVSRSGWRISAAFASPVFEHWLCLILARWVAGKANRSSEWEMSLRQKIGRIAQRLKFSINNRHWLLFLCIYLYLITPNLVSAVGKNGTMTKPWSFINQLFDVIWWWF